MSVGKCPFCGSEETTVAFLEITENQPTTEKPYRVMCEGCMSMGPFETSVELAIARWNEVSDQIFVFE
jgi:Lar family restriction alleviation protein